MLSSCLVAACSASHLNQILLFDGNISFASVVKKCESIWPLQPKGIFSFFQYFLESDSIFGYCSISILDIAQLPERVLRYQYTTLRMVLGHAATAVIALQHRHVAVACVVVWAWHVCGPGGVGGVRKNSAWACHAHTRHTPGTHQAHAGQAHIMHMACT